MQGPAWTTTEHMDSNNYHFSAPALHCTNAIQEGPILSLIRCLQQRSWYTGLETGLIYPDSQSMLQGSV